jgi:hypothetical protein
MWTNVQMLTREVNIASQRECMGGREGGGSTDDLCQETVATFEPEAWSPPGLSGNDGWVRCRISGVRMERGVRCVS